MHPSRGAGGGRGTIIDGLIMESFLFDSDGDTFQKKKHTKQKGLRFSRVGRLAFLGPVREFLVVTGTARKRTVTASMLGWVSEGSGYGPFIMEDLLSWEGNDGQMQISGVQKRMGYNYRPGWIKDKFLSI